MLVELALPPLRLPVAGVVHSRTGCGQAELGGTCVESHAGRSGVRVAAAATSAALVSSAVVLAHAAAVHRRRHGCRSAHGVTLRASEAEAAKDSFRKVTTGTPDGKVDWINTLPKREDLEKWENGEKWILVKDGKLSQWRKQSEVGIYRYTDAGYESRTPEGEWVNYAQMPQDTSHLTDAQRDRLVRELRGEIKVSLSTDDIDDSNFTPLAKVPPLEKWPFQRAAITEDLIATEEHLKPYRQLEYTDELGGAFFIGQRWKASNEARRHLGYNVNDDIKDVANMNGSVLALRCFVDQLRRVQKLRKQSPEEALPSDAYRLQQMRVNGILGTDQGSAIAMWIFREDKKRVMVDICVGDDSMELGPHAEEILLRHLAQKGAELGAQEIWCRTRRTESGKVYAPDALINLGFEAVPEDEQEKEEEWETLTVYEEKKDIKETVPSLHLWLTTRGLERHMQAANTWCYEMGATDINEVVENKEDFAEFLGDELTEEEKDRLFSY